MEVQEVLDLGTGTGIWAIELAEQNPHMNITAIDLRFVLVR